MGEKKSKGEKILKSANIRYAHADTIFQFWGNDKLTGSPKGPWIFARLQRCAVNGGNILNKQKKSLTGNCFRIEPDSQQKKFRNSGKTKKRNCL